MLDAFLTHLHRGGTYAYYHVLPQKRSRWYAVADPPTIDPARCTSNLYFSVHPLSQIPRCNAYGEIRAPQYVRGHLADVAVINCLYAEFDAKDFAGDKVAILAHLDQLPVPAPSVLIDSGGGVHSYWLLKEPYILDTEDRLNAAKHIQAAWPAVVGADAVKDLARILRVPGSTNYKYDPPRPVQWLVCDLDRQYTLPTLTAHLPPRKQEPYRLVYQRPTNSIQEFNDAHRVEDVLQRYGYKAIGRRKMLSPWSTTGQAGVTLDDTTNRAFVHHTSDPLCDGYWKRPFDVVCKLDYDGNAKKAVAAIREGWQ